MTRYVLLAHVPPTGVDAFTAYEDAVLPLLAEHGGRLERRLRAPDGTVEVHVLSFAGEDGLAAYRADPRREAAGRQLVASGAETELVAVQDVAVPAPAVPQPELPLTGRCLCGAIRFAVHAPLEASWYCHCTRCQHRTGTSSSAGARTAPGAFELLSGEDHVREWAPPDGHVKCFCAICGGHVWSRDPSRGDVRSIRLGAFDGDPGIRPAGRQFTAYAATWEPIPDDGLPRWPERNPAASVTGP
jgi:hypothetical protein